MYIKLQMLTQKHYLRPRKYYKHRDKTFDVMLMSVLFILVWISDCGTTGAWSIENVVICKPGNNDTAKPLIHRTHHLSAEQLSAYLSNC